MLLSVGTVDCEVPTLGNVGSYYDAARLLYPTPALSPFEGRGKGPNPFTLSNKNVNSTKNNLWKFMGNLW